MSKFCSLFIALISIISCKSKETNPLSINQVTPVTNCGTLTTDTSWYAREEVAPKFEGLGDLTYTITTSNPEVQFYFDQGLRLSYAFNHAEAARSFYYASKLDTSCAMCYWGFAYVLGPNYNGGMEADNYQRAYSAIQKAIQYSSRGTTKEKQLIQAMAKRYVEQPVENRYSLDSSYSVEMKKLHQTYPDDPEIAALYVESIMDLHPWDLWTKQGQPKSWTPEIVSIIEKLIKKYPEHPGFHHFYIHAVEASLHPENAMESAEKFDAGMVPGAGHLVHMPSHIYIRTGDYHKGSLSNIQAIKVDSQYLSSCHAQGVYPLAYYPHNYHFLVATATLEGNKEWALMAADKVREHVNTKLMKDPGWATLQHYYLIPYFVDVKFGQWDSILIRQEPFEDLPYIKAIRHYARGMALLYQNDSARAKIEMKNLSVVAQDSSLKELSIWGINTIAEIVNIASLVLQAEIYAKEKSFDSSIKLLQQAILLEDKLNYNEPPDWFFSVRHHLGSIYIDAGKYPDAIKLYQEDLRILPKNGWAYHGLIKAYQLNKDNRGLAEVQNELQLSWKYADVVLDGSRIK